MELEDRGFNLAEQIGAVVGNCESQALSKGLKIETQVDPNLPAVVRGDALRLRQILLNLLSNAIKFTDAGTIAVRAQAGGERSAATRSGSPQPIGSAEHGIHTVVIEVEDPGIGIAPEDQPFIFDAFRQVDGSYTRRQEGTGLGLAITRRLIDLMGGNIALDSASGRGSRFIVTLPFNAADETA
jgi:signal transduction histidine kinase